MTQERVLATLQRDATAMHNVEDLADKLRSGRRLRIKLGADPSAPDLHLGHSVVLRKLKLLQELGHEIVFVIGDFTGMIGDPSGRNKTRPPLTFEETRRNGQTYFEQVSRILDPERTTIVYNSEWLGQMTFSDVLQLAGKYTLARILERDDFAQRYTQGAPIGLHEIFYPLMQGYDSVALHADIEVGGSDQTFNLLVGRELQRDYGQAPQVVMTFPLLPGLDGTLKMSKSQGNTIGLSEPAPIMYEKCMRVPDGLLSDYFRLTTDLSEDDYRPLLERDIRAAHRRYAQEIVTLYWGASALPAAEARYAQVARGATPDDLPRVALPYAQAPLAELLRDAGLAASTSEARRLVAGGGIRVNGDVVRDFAQVVALPAVLARGKSRFVQALPDSANSVG